MALRAIRGLGEQRAKISIRPYLETPSAESALYSPSSPAPSRRITDPLARRAGQQVHRETYTGS
jgi:hypothetical protein